MHPRRAAAALTLAATALALPGAATADTGSTEPFKLGGGMVIKSLRAANELEAVNTTVKIKGLPDNGEASFSYDTGVLDGQEGPSQYHGWVLIVDKAAGQAATAKWYLTSAPNSKQQVVCPGAEVTWNTTKRKISATIPHSCFGDDTGMVRVGFAGPFEVTHGYYVQTRPLQRGERGAAYGDIDGDNKTDRVKLNRLDDTTYKVTITPKNGPTLRAKARARYDDPTVVSRLDVNQDGRAELITSLGEIGGATNIHLFTLSDDRLKVVTRPDGSEFSPIAEASGSEGVRCVPGGVETWTAGPADRNGKVTLSRTLWSLSGATVTPTNLPAATIDAGIVGEGNWSFGSCATR